jgi:hypothetical protein
VAWHLNKGTVRCHANSIARFTSRPSRRPMSLPPRCCAPPFYPRRGTDTRSGPAVRARPFGRRFRGERFGHGFIVRRIICAKKLVDSRGGQRKIVMLVNWGLARAPSRNVAHNVAHDRPPLAPRARDKRLPLPLRGRLRLASGPGVGLAPPAP